MLNNAMVGILHVSQNIPTRSSVDVSMRTPTNVQVHVSVVGPRFSSLTWKLDGNPDENEIDIEQRTPDMQSKLNCKPSCFKKGVKSQRVSANQRSMRQNRNIRRKQNKQQRRTQFRKRPINK